MIVGLLIALALCAPPAAPGLVTEPHKEAHKDAVARFGAAVWNLRRDRLLTAAKQLETAAKQDPSAATPKRELIKVYAQIGREPDAIRIAKDVLERDPSDVDTAHALARLYYSVGELKEAVAVAKQAIEIDVPVARADKAVALYRDVATIGEKADDPAIAAKALTKAVDRLVGERAEVIQARAFTRGEVDAIAAECLERLGKAQTKLRQFSEAATSFESAAKLYADPKVKDPSAALRLAWNLSGVYQAKGDAAAAIKHLNVFLRLKPITTAPYERLAKLLRAAQRGDEVIPLLRRFVTADPKNLAIQVVLAEELARDPGSQREADRLFSEILTANNDPKFMAVVIRSHAGEGRPGEIIALVDQAFTVLKEDRKEEKPLTSELVKARAFAAERVRVIGDILRADARISTAVLRAGTADLQNGTKRNHQVYYFLGQLAAHHDELALAALQFEEAVRRAPTSRRGVEGTQGDAYAALINVLHRAGKPDQLARVCREGLRNSRDVAPVYFNFHLAGALAELGEAEAALEAADKAIEQTGESDRLTVRLQKVYVLRLLGRWVDAIALGTKLLDEFDSPADRLRTRYALASAYWGAKKRDEAEAVLRAILDIDPNHAAAANDLGFQLADQGRNLDEAERLVRSAIASDRIDRLKAGNAEPENAAYIDSLGWVLFRRGKLPEARAELERASKLHAGALDPVVWDHLGDVLFRLGEKAKAKAAWEKARGLYDSEPRGTARARRDGRAEELKRKLKLVP